MLIYYLLSFAAILMSLAWLVCASLAMFIARYMKPVWGELLGLKAWFQVFSLKLRGRGWGIVCQQLSGRWHFRLQSLVLDEMPAKNILAFRRACDAH